MGFNRAQRHVVTLERFVAEYHLAPLSLEEFARGAAEIVGEDAYDLRIAAMAFIRALQDFERQLERFEVEIG